MIKVEDLAKEGVKFVRFFFPDVYGINCDFSVPIKKFKDSLERGFSFDGIL